MMTWLTFEQRPDPARMGQMEHAHVMLSVRLALFMLNPTPQNEAAVNAAVSIYRIARQDDQAQKVPSSLDGKTRVTQP